MIKKVLLGSVAFLILLVVAAPFLIPTGAISRKVEEAAQENLHKKTVIGSLRLSLFPQLGLKIKDLKIGEEKSGDYYVSLDSFFVQIQWKPLLKKQIHISTLEFFHPVVELYPAPETANNSATTSPTSNPNIQLHIQKLTIDQASFTKFDAKMKPEIHVENFSEKLSFDYSADGKYTIAGTTLIPEIMVATPMGVLGREMKIEIEKNLVIDPQNISIQKLNIHLGNLPIALQGNIRDYSGDHPGVDIHFSGGPSDIENIIGLIPSSMISSELKNIQSSGNLFVDGKLKGIIDSKNPAASVERSDFRIAMTLKNGSVSHPQLQKPMNNIAFTLDVDPKTLQIKNFHADYGQSKIDYSAKITSYLTNPSFEFHTDTSLNMQDVSALRQDLPVKDLEGDVLLSLNANGTTKDIQHTNLAGTVQAKGLAFQYPEFKYDIDNLNSLMKLDGSNINIQNLSFFINKSNVSLKGNIQNPMALMDDSKTSIMKFAFQANSPNINADNLMPPPDDSDAPLELPPTFYKLDGSLGFTIQKLTFNKLEMAQAKGNLLVHKGIVEFKPVSVGVFGGNIAMDGTVNLKNRKKPMFDINTEMKNVKVQKALAYADNVNKLLKLDNSLSADIALKANAKGDLKKDYSLDIASLDSSGSFSLSNAVLQNHPIQKAFSGFFKSNVFEHISINQWTQAFTIENGKINVNNLALGAKDFNFKINGWQSIDGQNYFAVDAKLPPSLTNKILDKLPSPLAALAENQKSLTLPFTVTGNVASPQVGLDSQKMTAVAKDQLTDQLKSEAVKTTSSLKENAMKMISPQKKGATQKKPDIKKNMNDALKKLF